MLKGRTGGLHQAWKVDVHLKMNVAEVAAGIGDLDVISARLIPVYAFTSNVVGCFWEVLEITVICHR